MTFAPETLAWVLPPDPPLLLPLSLPLPHAATVPPHANAAATSTARRLDTAFPFVRLRSIDPTSRPPGAPSPALPPSCAARRAASRDAPRPGVFPRSS